MITVTHVEVALAPGTPPAEGSYPLAYCTITLSDVFVVHNVKVIRTAEGGTIVSMPSREITAHCPCGAKPRRTASYCDRCGAVLATLPIVPGEKRFIEVCHPITRECRALVVREVMKAYGIAKSSATEEDQRAAG